MKIIQVSVSNHDWRTFRVWQLHGILWLRGGMSLLLNVLTAQHGDVVKGFPILSASSTPSMSLAFCWVCQVCWCLLPPAHHSIEILATRDSCGSSGAGRLLSISAASERDPYAPACTGLLCFLWRPVYCPCEHWGICNPLLSPHRPHEWK